LSVVEFFEHAINNGSSASDINFIAAASTAPIFVFLTLRIWRRSFICTHRQDQTVRSISNNPPSLLIAGKPVAHAPQ